MAAKLHHLSACVQEHSCPVLLPCSVLPCPGLPCLFLLLQPLAKSILYQETHTGSQLLHLTVTKHTLLQHDITHQQSNLSAGASLCVQSTQSWNTDHAGMMWFCIESSQACAS